MGDAALGADRPRTLSRMDRAEIETFPGGEIVTAGLGDLAAGHDSVEAAAVLMASRRLRGVGIEVPGPPAELSASHHLYDLLSAELGDAAHSRYNAIVRRVISFARSAEHARPS